MTSRGSPRTLTRMRRHPIERGRGRSKNAPKSIQRGSGGRRLSASLPLLLARPQTTRMASGRRRRTQTTRITKNDSEYEGGDGDVYSGSAEIGFQLECEHVIRGSIWHEGEHDFTKRHLWRAVAIGQLQWARIGEECRVTRSCVWRGAHWVA